MNFGTTIFHARQLVNHGHILVNGKKVTIPSYQVNNKDLIQVKPKSKPYILSHINKHIESGNHMVLKEVPSYLEVDFSILSGIFLYTPIIEEVPYKSEMNISKVVEFYGKR